MNAVTACNRPAEAQDPPDPLGLFIRVFPVAEPFRIDDEIDSELPATEKTLCPGHMLGAPLPVPGVDRGGEVGLRLQQANRDLKRQKRDNRGHDYEHDNDKGFS